jgi:hypothetical protein
VLLVLPPCAVLPEDEDDEDDDDVVVAEAVVTIFSPHAAAMLTASHTPRPSCTRLPLDTRARCVM